MGKVLTIVFGLLGAIAIFWLLSLLFIKLGWSLFVVPVFGLPELTWLQAFGFSLLAGCFRSTSTSKSNS